MLPSCWMPSQTTLDGCGYDTVVAQPTHQQTLWTPLKYTPNATNSHHQQPSLNHYPLWPKLASQNVNLRCHSPVQSSPVACITDTVKSKVALSTTPVLTSPSPTSLLSRTPHAPLSPFPLRCTRYLKGWISSFCHFSAEMSLHRKGVSWPPYLNLHSQSSSL